MTSEQRLGKGVNHVDEDLVEEGSGKRVWPRPTWRAEKWGWRGATEGKLSESTAKELKKANHGGLHRLSQELAISGSKMQSH